MRAVGLLMVGALLIGSPAAAGGAGERRPDAAEIEALIEGVEEANNAGDVERWVGYFAADAVYMPPGVPAVTTREGLVEIAEAGFRHRSDVDIEPVEIRVFDDWAFARTEVAGTVTVHGSGEVVDVDTKQIVIYTRGADGAWRIARMISNGNGS